MSLSFFFNVPEKTPRTVWRCQPRGARHFIDRCPLRATQHRDHSKPVRLERDVGYQGS